MTAALLRPDYLFEVSWEVCNKVGGIHTVISTKAKMLESRYGDKYILIGPDIWKGVNNPEFAEDASLFKSWKQRALAEGLKVKIGRWKIQGSPIAILVDFTTLFTSKNEIFTDLWVRYKLDSLTGAWDYIEPALFGYAAAEVIACFYKHHLNNDDKIIAQFHEWMTGTGILYLKNNVPQVATVFTTHATVLGRAIAGSGVRFYSQFESFIPEKAANDFQVVSKHSLEKASAINADCFTTVSRITARECTKFLDKAPDLLTNNGFDISILPSEQLFDKSRERARKTIIRVAEGLFNQNIPEDSIFIIKSGRYEFRNKGIDIFINSLAELQTKYEPDKTVVGIIFVPAHQTGPRKELLDRIKQPDFSRPLLNETLTHYLQGTDSDPILKAIEKSGLHNSPNSHVKVIFVPTYLDGNDGIFNMHYYDLLIGFDLAVFPSYYEPWGYTPLESIAYHIPSVTTDVSGFGAIINDELNGSRKGITVIQRTDDNDTTVAAEIAHIIYEFSRKKESDVLEAKSDAFHVSLNFLWGKLITQYENAYDIALTKSQQREVLFHNKPQAQPILPGEPVVESMPNWRSIVVEADLPGPLQALLKLSKNLWWSWNFEAHDLFRYIDPELWDNCNNNPIVMIRSLSLNKIDGLTRDDDFLKLLGDLDQKFDAYMAVATVEHPHIAYFSMEYGLCSFLKLYSGGLGVLAGDHLKEASDGGAHITGVGLLYKNGYFRQKFSVHGEQLTLPDTQDINNLPLSLVTTEDQAPLLINFFLPGRTVLVQVWRLDVGRISLYLLDTDLPQNAKEDREITSYLYGGDQEMRIKQEVLLGIIGVRTLNKLNIDPDIFHCNEGHAAFISVERIYRLIKDDNLSFEEAVEITKSSTLFTTHTAMPAAIDLFGEDLVRKYLADKVHFFNIDWSKFIGLGRQQASDPGEKFSMANFGARMSQEINAVSKIHERVSRRLFNPLWKNYKPGELHIRSITNGVHFPTWAAAEWQKLFATKLNITTTNATDQSAWEQIKNVPAQDLWNIHVRLKKKLINAIKENSKRAVSLKRSDGGTFNAISNLNENALIVGFARRFVTYKRSWLLFSDIERLSRILASTDKPVIFIFAGKAHPRDQQSIDLISRLVNYSADPLYRNAIIFLRDYDMEIARLLVQGVDVWLNTPERHSEASGTSGMKAAMNGVLNFSVLDGWWAEAYNGSNGWMLSEDPVYNDKELQNQLDAENIYSILENEIIPLFYYRDKHDVPLRWVDKMRASLASICPQFNMTRALAEYRTNYYEQLFQRNCDLKRENYAIARDLVKWKKNIQLHWNEVDVISIEVPWQDKFKGLLGEKAIIKIVLDIGKLSPDDVGVDIVIAGGSPDDNCFVKEFSVTGTNGREVSYECTIRMEQTGAFEYAFRIYPNNVNLPYKQDLDLVKWV